MTLTISLSSKDAINKVNRYCLVYDVSPKCQYSKLTGNVIYVFGDKYPDNIEGVEYEEI